MSIQKVIKRSGEEVVFQPEKIRIALQKANKEVPESLQADEALIDQILQNLQQEKSGVIGIEEIQDFIESELIHADKSELAKKYIIYRYQRALIRRANTTDDSILTLIRNDNIEVGQENSNKDSAIASTQRDLIAGEVSKDLARRVMLPESLVKAHDE